MARTQTRALLVAAGLAVFTAVFFWRLLATEEPENYGLASADLFLYSYPVYEQVYARVRAWTLPTWNPWQLCGTPWLAAMQAGLYYPGHIVYLALPTHVGMAVAGAMHLFIAALGTYAFTRRAGLGTIAALAAALVFAFRGSMPFLLNGPNLQEAASWIGVGAFATILLVEASTARAAALLAVAGGMSFVAGYPQHTVYLLYVWATLWLAWTAARRPSARMVVASGAWFALAVLLAVLASAAQLLPTAEVARDGSRALSGMPDAAMAPLGNYAQDVLQRFPVVGRPLSFGAVPLMLAALATLGGRHRALAWWALALGLIAAVFSMGVTTPWFWIYRSLPAIGLFRGPDRLLLVVDFALAVAAGIGLDALVRRDGGDRRRVALVVGVVPTLGAAWLAWSHVWHGTPGATAVLAGIVAGAAWCLFGGGRREATAVGIAVLALLGAEVLMRTDLGLVYPYTAARVAWFEKYDPVYRELALRAEHERSWVLRTLDPPVATKHATRHRFRSIEDHEPINLRRQNQYWTFFGEGVVAELVDGLPFNGAVPHVLRPAPDGTSPGTRRRLLDLAGVSRILMQIDAVRRPQTDAFLRTSGLAAPRAGTPFWVVANPNAMPRAWVVHRTAPAPPAPALLPLLADPAFDPFALAYVEGEPGFTADTPPPHGQAARFVEDGEHVVEVEATAAVPGLLVLADTYAPGWRATVDGVPAPILPTNHLFRGVPVPAGVHHVRFTYEPWTVPVGQALSLVGLLVIAVFTRFGAPTRP